jgi:hypothetical protein
MPDLCRTEALRQLTLSKIHLTPRLLEDSPRRISRRFDSVWAPAEALARHLNVLPTALVQYLIRISRGHLVLTAEASSYNVEAMSRHGQALEAVAFLSLADLVEEPLRVFHIVGHLLDHVLGCGGDPLGKWLSDGHGLNGSWAGIGSQIPPLFELGYAVDEVAATDSRQYFARSLAWYIQDRPRLNVSDPLIERLLRLTLFSESFCRRTLSLGCVG